MNDTLIGNHILDRIISKCSDNLHNQNIIEGSTYCMRNYSMNTIEKLLNYKRFSLFKSPSMIDNPSPEPVRYN